ncbi:YetF domain-containing protein [Blastococcus sp. CCUG 61487]|uniref:DUF421 domain-containing protein n=1 Tax=Blastococcus sp. CCUG 61487 TaxID=1840703 RepID=UPI0010BFFD4D|nr:YetF domain-containing protein [Blastococcus sp. CCUG 61487]TKJ28371.1 hypothetical protein A6V29_02955 [Blastococcus sp. CCUG 61487]
MWFDSWSDIARVLAVGAAAYVTVVVVLRLAGRRALSKLNAFDWVISVALGSTLATILLSSDVSWAEGATALALLAGLQFVVTWTTTRLPDGRSVITAPPTLLLNDGRLLPDALRAQRVTDDEVRQAVRATGSGDLGDIAAVVLESDGSLSVITAAQAGNRSALEGVHRAS